MMIIPLRFFMKENLMMMIPEIILMTKRAGAILEYTIPMSHPITEVSKNKYSIVIKVKAPSAI